jgi:LCP family protein required for cell wall assembly
MNKKSLVFVLNKIKRRVYRFLPFLKGVFLAIVILVLFLLARIGGVSLLKIFTSLRKSGFPVVSKEIQLKQKTGRTNILLLGLEGRGEKENLTDSLIFISMNLEKGNVVLLSIPRDLWVPSLQAKINTAYHYGEEKKQGGGVVLAKASAEEILGQPVHYVLCLDFNGFKNAVDLLGGINIEVERAFDDYKYPIPGKENVYPESLRYEHLHFDAGLQKMDGERALKYVRSRYAQGPEGSDFSRSARQQRFLLAFKKEVLSKETLLNPKKIVELVETFGNSIDTDVAVETYPSFVKLLLKIKEESIKRPVLNSGNGGNGGLLYEPTPQKYDNQFVLMPKNDDWNIVKDYVSALLE